MKDQKKRKPINRINRTSVQNLAIMLYENVIDINNIKEMPVADQANILIKCLPYLLEKKGSESNVSERDVTNIGRIINDMYLKQNTNDGTVNPTSNKKQE